MNVPIKYDKMQIDMQGIIKLSPSNVKESEHRCARICLMFN